MDRAKTITAWKPTDYNKVEHLPPYQYVEDPTKMNESQMMFMYNTPEMNSKEIGHRRFSSSVGKYGKNLNPFQGYLPNPYDNQKDKDRIEKLMHKNHFKHGPFQNRPSATKPFCSDMDLYDRRNNFTGTKPPYVEVDIDTKFGGLCRKSDKNWKATNPAKKVNSKYNKTLGV